MRYRLVHDDGRVEVFEYGTPARYYTKQEGLARVDWLVAEVGEHDFTWTMHYASTSNHGFEGVQFWFKRQEDFVRFSMFWS